TEPAFGIARAHLLAPAVVGHRQRPSGFDGIVGHDDAAALHGIAKCMLERIDHEFSDNQAEVLGLLTAYVATLATDFNRNWLVVADHRLRDGFAQTRQIGDQGDRPAHDRCMEVLLHSRDRHDPAARPPELPVPHPKQPSWLSWK